MRRVAKEMTLQLKASTSVLASNVSLNVASCGILGAMDPCGVEESNNSLTLIPGVDILFANAPSSDSSSSFLKDQKHIPKSANVKQQQQASALSTAKSRQHSKLLLILLSAPNGPYLKDLNPTFSLKRKDEDRFGSSSNSGGGSGIVSKRSKTNNEGTGRPRGRPKGSLGKGTKKPTGRPRGRPKGSLGKGTKKPTGRPRGRPKGSLGKGTKKQTGKPRGRPKGSLGKKNKNKKNLNVFTNDSKLYDNMIHQAQQQMNHQSYMGARSSYPSEFPPTQQMGRPSYVVPPGYPPQLAQYSSQQQPQHPQQHLQQHSQEHQQHQQHQQQQPPCPQISPTNLMLAQLAWNGSFLGSGSNPSSQPSSRPSSKPGVNVQVS